jgi:hypothetical protein
MARVPRAFFMSHVSQNFPNVFNGSFLLPVAPRDIHATYGSQLSPFLYIIIGRSRRLRLTTSRSDCMVAHSDLCVAPAALMP